MEGFDRISVALIDDDELFIALIKEKLKKQGVTRIFTCFNTRSTSDYLAEVSAFKPDLILLDNLLLHTSGVREIPKLKSMAPDAKIIVLSGQEEVKVVADAFRIGAEGYIQKNAFMMDKIKDIIIRIRQGDSLTDNSQQLTEWNTTIKSSFDSNVFILEDDSLFAFAIQYHIDQYGFHYSEVFTDPLNAITRVHEHPDLLILDYGLPTVSGKEVLLLYKKQSPKTRIIMLSSQNNVEVAANLFELGIDEYIVKDENWKQHLVFAMEQTLAA